MLLKEAGLINSFCFIGTGSISEQGMFGTIALKDALRYKGDVILLVFLLRDYFIFPFPYHRFPLCPAHLPNILCTLKQICFPSKSWQRSPN